MERWTRQCRPAITGKCLTPRARRLLAAQQATKHGREAPAAVSKKAPASNPDEADELANEEAVTQSLIYALEANLGVEAFTDTLHSAISEAEDACSTSLRRPAHVIVGDRVLLQFEDQNKGRIQYMIEGLVNDEAKGVLAIHDEKAMAILDRSVGDRVCLNFGGKSRFAVIEKILNFDQNANV